jgi:hypothetical protein
VGIFEEAAMLKEWIAATSSLLLALSAQSARAGEEAGQVLWVSGAVQIVRVDGAVKTAAKGAVLRPGETIRTGKDAHAQLLMSDRGLIAVRPESSLRVAAYRYDGRHDGTESALLQLVQGGMRSITGAIGETNKEKYKLETPTASIGIRGTDHETFIVPDAGTYNRVTLGGTYLETGGGRIELAPGEVGFAGRAAAPSFVTRTPEFMHVAAAAPSKATTGMRGRAPGDERRIQVAKGAPFNGGVVAHGKRAVPNHVTLPVLPAAALGENKGGGHGIGKGVGKASKGGAP